MKKTIIAVIIGMVITGTAYAQEHHLDSNGGTQYYNNRPLTGGTGEQTAVAIAEMVNAIIQVSKSPTAIYQVPAIIIPREPSKEEAYVQKGFIAQPFCGYFGANYLSSYLDATNGILVVKGNIQILLPNDGYTREVEQKGNKIIIHNVNTGKDMVVKIQ